MRARVLLLISIPPLLLVACGGESSPRSAAAAPALADDDLPRPERIEAALRVLASDEMEGRRAGTRGEIREE